MSIFEDLKLGIIKGDKNSVIEKVNQGLAEKINPISLLNDGLLKGMDVIGERWKKNEIFIPEVLIAARAMNAGSEILEKELVKEGFDPVGKVVTGTVKGDLHDIGKNLIGMMLKGKGFEVIDLGTNVTKEQFLNAAKEHNAKFICMSSLLTTTMVYMKEVVEFFKENNMRDDVLLACGGAPVTQKFADEIGADLYTDDAVTLAGELLSRVEG